MTPIARVTLNDVEIGSVPAETYYGILAAGRRNVRLYLAQAWNLLGCAWRLLLRTLMLQPVVWFTIAAAFVMAQDGSAELVVEYARTAEAAELIADMANLGGKVFVLTLSFTLIFSVALGRPFGFENVFHGALIDQLRLLLEVPTTGGYMTVEVIESQSTDGVSRT